MANQRVSAAFSSQIRFSHSKLLPTLTNRIHVMRETKSTASLRPIDISYRNDLKNGVGTRADRAREKDCSLGSGLDCSGAKIRDDALQP